jgi:5-methylcytosine-specific restriction endonuclease McrA
MKKTPLQRKTPLRAKRRTLRRGQLNPREKLALRSFVYERDKGLCQLRLHKDCTKDRKLPFNGSLFVRAHLVHIKSRGAGGSWEPDNLLIGCPSCHLISVHSQGKRIPARSAKKGTGDDH